MATLATGVASWLIPSIISAAGTGVAAYQGHQNSQLAKKQTEETKTTARAQAQANAEQAPELIASAGTSDAVKKRRTSFGIEDSIIANNATNQTTGNQYWG